MVTDSYKFHNDGKSAADTLFFCSTREYAQSQAYQEVLRFTAVVYVDIPDTSCPIDTGVVQITAGDDEDAPVLQVSRSVLVWVFDAYHNQLRFAASAYLERLGH